MYPTIFQTENEIKSLELSLENEIKNGNEFEINLIAEKLENEKRFLICLKSK
jgi:hypothetical protein